jgi:hypothetical protein
MAKQTIRYRGHIVRLWEKSYSIDGGKVNFVGEEPDLAAIKRDIDAVVLMAENAQRSRDFGIANDKPQHRYFASTHFGIVDRRQDKPVREFLSQFNEPIFGAFDMLGVAIVAALIAFVTYGLFFG